MHGYVYLIKDCGKENTYKIGVTKNIVNKRKQTLQTGNSSKLEIISFYETNYPFKLETMLHRLYSDYNIQNEWFELTDDVVEKFLIECKNKERIIIALKDNPFF